MAVRKPRRTGRARKTSARVRPRKTAKASRTRKKTAVASKTATRAPVVNRRRRVPETLRLRTFEPSFTVDDLDRSMRFYTDVLGFIVVERWTDGDVLRGVMLKAGSCQLALTQDNWAKGRDRKKGQGMSIWCTTAQDIDGLAERILTAGGRLTDGPKDQPWGARSLSVEDPDGFALTVYRENRS
jgi:catechol 2,3-dioxygenase-like lactoylglutathione lyase family enzyme